MARGGGRRGTTRAPGMASGAPRHGSNDAAVPGDVGALEGALRVRFRDHDLAKVALTHRSFAFEHGLEETNERLEFLGDAVLGLVVTDRAFRQFPDRSEGELAKLRAAAVNMTSLAEVSRELGIGELVLLGRGEELSGGRLKASILADAMEAVLGAVYLDVGLATARRLIDRLFWPRMKAYADGEGDRDYKTALQELASRGIGSVPEYRVASRGPDHAKEFTATVYLAAEQWGRGQGRSKKEAEQQAASEALSKLDAGAGSADEARGEED
jgi:ribonuclease-3